MYWKGRLSAGRAARSTPVILGMISPPFFDIYHIAYANVQQGDLFGVVQRGPLDGRSGQLHRIEVGDGGDGSGASHLEIDAFEPRERLFGLELESHGPSGAPWP